MLLPSFYSFGLFTKNFLFPTLIIILLSILKELSSIKENTMLLNLICRLLFIYVLFDKRLG